MSILSGGGEGGRKTSIVNDQLVKVARRVMGTYSLNDDCDRTNLGGLGDPSHWFYYHSLHW